MFEGDVGFGFRPFADLRNPFLDGLFDAPPPGRFLRGFLLLRERLELGFFYYFYFHHDVTVPAAAFLTDRVGRRSLRW